MGKNWARGLTQETDARVARAAAGHRGLRYVRRTPPERWKWRRRSGRIDPLTWNPATAYALGLAATDGCLVDGRHLAFGSEDLELVELFLGCVGRAGARISVDNGGRYFRTMIGDVALYRFLEEAGLTRRKSLILGPLRFPDSLFWDVARGLIDGDGTIKNYIHNPIRRTKYKNYIYERLTVQFLSGSPAHAQWIHEELTARGLRNALIRENHRESNFTGRPYTMYKVQLGKHASIALLSRTYADPLAPRLTRKWCIWEDFRARYSDLEAAKLVRRAGAAGRSYAAVSRTAGPLAHEGSNPSSGTD